VREGCGFTTETEAQSLIREGLGEASRDVVQNVQNSGIMQLGSKLHYTLWHSCSRALGDIGAFAGGFGEGLWGQACRKPLGTSYILFVKRKE